MNKKENKTNKQTDDDFIKFLKEKKAKDGKLSKFGEWILSGKKSEWTYDEKDLKFIMK